MSDFLKVTTDADFEKDVLQTSGLVLIDFWAPWCQPCKMIMPQIEMFAEEYAPKGVTVYKLNVDENSATPQKFGVRGIPTLMLFKDGELVETQVGGINQAVLAKMVAAHMA